MSDPGEQRAVEALHDLGAQCLERIDAHLVGDYKLTLVARNTAYPDGSHDVLLGDDDADEAIAAIGRLRGKAPWVRP